MAAVFTFLPLVCRKAFSASRASNFDHTVSIAFVDMLVPPAVSARITAEPGHLATWNDIDQLSTLFALLCMKW